MPEQDHTYLMHLPHSSLHLSRYNEVFDDDNEAPQRKQAAEEADTTWDAQGASHKTFCEYPPRSTSDVLYSNEDFAKFFKQLPLMGTLQPWKSDLPLAPRGANPLRGHMDCSRRAQHDDTTWMSSGELELFMSLLLRDRRYDKDITILPVGMGTYIQRAWQKKKACMHAGQDGNEYLAVNLWIAQPNWQSFWSFTRSLCIQKASCYCSQHF